MTRFKFDAEKHKVKLTALLVGLTKLLDSKIAFKGGTAAMIFYDLPRVSLDLDFDILVPLNDQDRAGIQRVAEKHGQIKEMTDKRSTIFFLLDYEKDTPNIKLEFNKRVWKNNSYNYKWLYGVSIQVADMKTMATNKLVALLERRSPVARDVFDVYYFLSNNWPLEEALIRERTGLSLKDLTNQAIGCLENNFNQKNIIAGVGDLLTESQKSWAKAKLISETKELLRSLRDSN